jgi:hypothetical protein
MNSPQPLPHWDWNWDLVFTLFGAHSNDAWLGLALTAATLLIGVHGLLYPLFYHMLKFQAPSAMRLAYLAAVLVSVGIYHYLTWDWLFVLLLRNYWVWMAWFILFVAVVAALFMIPKKRYA